MSFPVFDLHCDTALALYDKTNDPHYSLRSSIGHIDLQRAKELGAYTQCFAMFTTPSFTDSYQKPVETVFREMLANFQRELEQCRDLILPAGSSREVEQNRAQGKMSAILTLEGPAGIGFSPDRLEELYNTGFRISTLGWNERNPLVGSHVTGGGLTDLGRAYVRECQRLGILVDVSHISDEGFWDIMEITQAPVIASHSNSRAVCPVSRNLTDDMYRAICQTGGTVGINLYTGFIDTEYAILDRVVDHIFHFLELDPTGKHLSLGGDLDGCEALPEGFADVRGYNALAQHLQNRGLDDRLLTDLYWNNAMGVMDHALHIHKG